MGYRIALGLYLLVMSWLFGAGAHEAGIKTIAFVLWLLLVGLALAFCAGEEYRSSQLKKEKDE